MGRSCAVFKGFGMSSHLFLEDGGYLLELWDIWAGTEGECGDWIGGGK